MAEALAEAGWIPDFLLRMGIRRRCAQVLQEAQQTGVDKDLHQKLEFVRKLKTQPIAIHTKDANKQHYEVTDIILLLILQ